MERNLKSRHEPAMYQRSLFLRDLGALLLVLVAIGVTPGFAASRSWHMTEGPWNQTAEAAKKPLTRVNVLALVAAGEPKERIASLIQERGINFTLTFGLPDEYREAFEEAGATEVLLEALRQARVTEPPTGDTAAEDRDDKVEEHLFRLLDFESKSQYREAEQECRAALKLEPQEPSLHFILGRILSIWQKREEAISEYRQGLRLDPESAHAYRELGSALHSKGDLKASLSAYLEAVRLTPDEAADPLIVEEIDGLGRELQLKPDLEGAIAAFREAVRLNPHEPSYQRHLDSALQQKAALEDVAQKREQLRLRPNDPQAHYDLGLALAKTMGERGAAIRELREALRLKPDFVDAHFKLALVLGQADDLDGAIAELREAVRLAPKSSNLHAALAGALVEKGDLKGAAEELRIASDLDPNNSELRAGYERLLKKSKR